MKAEEFLTFKAGTVWRVHKKARSIKYTGKKYHSRCQATVKMFTENKVGFRKPEYFLVLGDEKYEGGNESLGILHIEHRKENEIKRTLTVHKKESVPQMIE
jgi:hypothetical protein